MKKIKIEELKKHKEVESVIQFGSSVERKDFRDIDLCIFTSKKLSLNEKLKLLRNLPESYDISFYEDLPINIKKEVLSRGKIIFTSNYYQILKKLIQVDLEYPRYKSFLEDYHKKRMVAIWSRKR